MPAPGAEKTLEKIHQTSDRTAVSRLSFCPVRWVAQATGLCRVATRRSEWGKRANFSARLFPVPTSSPFRPATPECRATLPCGLQFDGRRNGHHRAQPFSGKASRGVGLSARQATRPAAVGIPWPPVEHRGQRARSHQGVPISIGGLACFLMKSLAVVARDNSAPRKAPGTRLRPNEFERENRNTREPGIHPRKPITT